MESNTGRKWPKRRKKYTDGPPYEKGDLIKISRFEAEPFETNARMKAAAYELLASANKRQEDLHAMIRAIYPGLEGKHFTLNWKANVITVGGPRADKDGL